MPDAISALDVSHSSNSSVAHITSQVGHIYVDLVCYSRLDTVCRLEIAKILVIHQDHSFLGAVDLNEIKCCRPWWEHGTGIW